MEPEFFPENFWNFYPYPSSSKRFIEFLEMAAAEPVTATAALTVATIALAVAALASLRHDLF